MRLKRGPSWLYLLAWLLAGLLVRAVWVTHPAPVPPPNRPLDSGGSPFDWDGGSYDCSQNRSNRPYRRG